MTTGQFWNAVTILCAVYDGRVIAGPMSLNWAKAVAREKEPEWMTGRAADIELRNPADYEAFSDAALEMNLETTSLLGATGMARLKPI